MHTLAIVGSRSFNDYNLFKSYLNYFLGEFRDFKIVSGGASGTDTMAKRYALENSIQIEEILPNWKDHGIMAGILRNTEIINKADWVIAFSQGNSKGTNDSIKKAQKANKQLNVVYIR